MKTYCWMMLAVAVVSAGSPAFGQTPTPAVRATLQAKRDTRVSGDVTVTPHGKSSMVHVNLTGPGAEAEALTLMSGPDCDRSVPRSAPNIALNRATGGSSNTLVDIPFSAFRSKHFVVDVRNATARAQQAEACARF